MQRFVRGSLLSWRVRLDVPLENIAEGLLPDFKVVADLEIEPEPLGRREVARQPQGGIGGDRSKAANDFVDSPKRDPDVLGKAVLRDSVLLQKLLEQEFARVDRQLLLHHWALLIVNEFDFVSVAADPSKADSPLIVDANAVPLTTISPERFEAICLWNGKVLEGLGRNP